MIERIGHVHVAGSVDGEAPGLPELQRRVCGIGGGQLLAGRVELQDRRHFRHLARRAIEGD